MEHPGIITLTTDFGLSDPYVGMMKGVILSINPEARVVDISHMVKAGDIPHAARLIQDTFKYFPKGALHVGVVDPGGRSSSTSGTIVLSALTTGFSGRSSVHTSM